ncbi:MAG: hypothetical protein ACLR8H_04185 [Clostridium sp.]
MNLKRVLIFLLILISFVINISSCSKKENYNKTATVYEEESLNFFKEKKIKFIYDMKVISGDKVVILASEEGIFKYFISEDKGEKWIEKKLEVLKSIERKISYAKISNKGDIVLTYSNEQGSFKSAFLSIEDNKFKELNINHSEEKGSIPYYFLEFLSNGNLIYFNETDSKLSQLDINKNKVKNILSVKDFPSGSIGKQFINYKGQYIKYYSLDTGKEISKLKIKENMSISLVSSENIYSNCLYVINKEGVFKNKLNSVEFKKVINGTNTSFGGNEMSPIYFCEIKNSEFLCIFYKKINGEDDGEYFLKKYKKSKEKDEVKVYSLYKNNLISEIVSKYNVENSNININYDIGIKDGEKTTKTEVIERLNNEILSGNGPEILILDDLPYDLYEEKGFLENIECVIKNQEEEGKLFNNIINYYNNENKYYKLPLRFNVPLVMGKDVDENQTLDVLTKNIKDLGKKNENIFKAYEPSEIIKLLYTYDSINWINKDGTINEEEIKNFMKNCKNIYSILKKSNTSESIKSYLDAKKYYSDLESFEREVYLHRDITILDLFYDKSNWKIEVGDLTNFNEISYILSIKDILKDYSYFPWSNNGQIVFTPNTLIGINYYGKNKDKAKKFLTEIFSEEYQSIFNNEDYGFSINKDIFYGELNEMIKIDSNGSLNINDNIIIENIEPNEEEINRFTSIVENMNISANYNTFLLDYIIEDMEKYILGKLDINKATNNIKDNIQKYKQKWR